MKYDFDKIVDRRGSESIKWDVNPNELPLSIADMDFMTAPEVIADLKKIIEFGVYGYCEPKDDWYEAYQNFFRDLHCWNIKKDDLFFSTGVVPTLSSSVRALTEAGDKVIVMPPVYNIFYNSIVNNKRVPYEVPLINDNGKYFIDFIKLEIAMKDSKSKLLFFCNPGNPVSRIWNIDEIKKIIILAKKYDVIVLSDEIHCDIARPGKKYVPFLTIEGASEIGFSAISPTKCFNLAGTQGSAIVIENEEIKKKVIRQLNTDECAEPNVIACTAAISAFNKGRDFLKQLNEYLFANRDFAFEYIKKNIPNLDPIYGDATYLLWIDIRKTNLTSEELVKLVREKTGLILNKGSSYGAGGEGFIRMSVAVPRTVLIDALERLKNALF